MASFQDTAQGYFKINNYSKKEPLFSAQETQR